MNQFSVYVTAVLMTSILSISNLFAAESDIENTLDGSLKIRQINMIHAEVNGIDIAYKVLGDKSHPSIVMIMGLGASHMLWGDRLPYQLVDAGFQVVLFDNRDVGESQHLDEFGKPTIWWQLLKNQFGFSVDAAYDLSDMATDSVALMDELNIDKAHIVGASMGGMIAQVIAAQYPERTLSLTSIMSTPGFADHLPPPGAQANDQLNDLATGETDDETTKRLHKMGFYPDSMPRQIMAILKSGDRSEQVKTISVPTLVLHGEDDTLIPLPHGEYTAELITGAKFVSFSGMGHNLPATVLPDIVSNIVGFLNGGD